MKKSKLRLPTVIFISLIVTFCNKRPFAHIELHGRLVHGKTKEPLKGGVELWTGESRPTEKGTTKFESVLTNKDGTFDIKSNAGWSSDDYTLRILVDTLNLPSETYARFHVNKNQNLDVGDIMIEP